MSSAPATAASFSPAAHVAALIRQRWSNIAPADAKGLDENASLKVLGKNIRDVVPSLFRECVLSLAQQNRSNYTRVLTEAEQRMEKYQMEMMRKALDGLFTSAENASGPKLTLKSLGKQLQQLLNTTKTYASAPNEFPWGPLAFALKFLMTQNGGSEVSCLYFSVAMILLRLNFELNHTLIEACLQLALVANPNHYQAIAQWGNVVKTVSGKGQPETDKKLLYCFQVAALIEESLKPGVGCVYSQTLRGLADVLYRCATRLPSVERRGILKASYKHLKRVDAKEQTYIHGLRTFGCVCLQLGGKYEEEGIKALEQIVENVKNPASYREKATNVLAEVRKGVPMVRVAASADWLFLAP